MRNAGVVVMTLKPYTPPLDEGTVAICHSSIAEVSVTHAAASASTSGITRRCVSTDNTRTCRDAPRRSSVVGRRLPRRVRGPHPRQFEQLRWAGLQCDAELHQRPQARFFRHSVEHAVEVGAVVLHPQSLG